MPAPQGIHPLPLPRPQVGIERLPARRMSNEPRESMNCKSCRKRKIKCNRLRPSCEACQVFQCPCIYDAVPKKRGPKTDVLEALLKRVDGLEAQLKEKKDQPPTPTTDSAPSLVAAAASTPNRPAGTQSDDETGEKQTPAESTDVKTQSTSAAAEASHVTESSELAVYTPSSNSAPSPAPIQPDLLLDTYFARFHAKPFYILDESSVRQRLQLNQLPNYLVHAIYAVAARYTPHPNGYQASAKLGEEYAIRARAEIDIDEPSVDALQACLLLVVAFTATGKGKKAYMLLTTAVGMTMAQELHREMDPRATVTPVERETRRRLFWTCYLLDRFISCGSKRPCLIADKTILLRLPCWSPNPAALPIEGEFFQCGTSDQYMQGAARKSQGSSGMLIEISRILGVTNRYLAAGGVKGDSHFPWHTLSNLSKIRQDLDIWASGTNDVFSSLDTLFGQNDSTVLVLSKLIYHLVHCLIYRPFLPIDLAELAGNGQHQSWQIEATNMCFLHANAIAELVELGKQTGTIEWPAFVGYCICTAGTVHIHGAHYSKNGPLGEMSVFCSSSEFLSREMQQLSELRYAWASVQHQRDTLQGIFNAHSELVKSLGNMHYPPVLHLEDFFDRYSNIGGPGGPSFNFDAANLPLNDVATDFAVDTYGPADMYSPGTEAGSDRPTLKRKSLAQGGRRRADSKQLAPLASNINSVIPLGLPTPSHPRNTPFSSIMISQNQQYQSSAVLHSPASLVSHGLPGSNMGGCQDSGELANKAAIAAAAAAAGFTIPSHPPPSQAPVHNPFSPPYTIYSTNSGPVGRGAANNNSNNNSDNIHNAGGSNSNTNSFDPMFGGVPTNGFSSPAAWNNGNDGATPRPALNHSTMVLAHGPQTQQLAHSPGGMSASGGSTGTGPAEEKDPFLTLLEQLADSENARGPGNEFDFFFAGSSQ
ncbi:fungal-specific transcription factor domain-domain-containing protein [Coniella lustricola]|uniref:Fungal-specific transcription factor domain-domain-containing protein n=1 Tax=Coniella lustricola TaxID=2025994 RepID=A0A2T3A421_9PEZI|nr:fungal-specific transcription factor domain-domain-containing protein [Coniella lustricola]